MASDVPPPVRPATSTISTSQLARSGPSGPARTAIPWGLLSALIVLVVLAMGRVVFNGFTTWDDPHTLAANTIMNPPDWTAIRSLWDPRNPVASLWTPVTYTVWGVVAEVAFTGRPDAFGVQLAPGYFHAASLLSHLLTTVLVFALLRRLIPLARPAGTPLSPQSPGRTDLAAAIGAAVFGVHPLQVESVAWTSGLKDLLWALWAVAAVYCYVRSAETRLLYRSRWWWAGALCFVLGTLSKPTAMVTPALALVVHAVLLRGSIRQCVVGLWPWFAFVPMVMYWTKVAQPGSGITAPPLWMRPLVATDALAFYLGKLVYPLGLAFDYGRHPASIIESGAVWWTWVIPVGVGAVIVLKRRAWPGVFAGGVWAVVGVAPVLGLSPFLFQYYSTVADHYVYGALAGVGLAAACAVDRLLGSRRAVVLGVAGLVLAGLAARSAVQMGTWRDSDTLYWHGLSVNPRSFSAHTNLGASVLALRSRKPTREELLAALAHLDRAIELRWDFSKSHDNRATALIMLGRPDEALVSVENALKTATLIPREVRGNMAAAYGVFGEYLYRKGRYAEAIGYLEMARSEALADFARDRRWTAFLENNDRLMALTRAAIVSPPATAIPPSTRPATGPTTRTLSPSTTGPASRP